MSTFIWEKAAMHIMASQIKDILVDTCLMELIEAEQLTPQQWVEKEMLRLQQRADGYGMTIAQYTNTFWTGEKEDWAMFK